MKVSFRVKKCDKCSNRTWKEFVDLVEKEWYGKAMGNEVKFLIPLEDWVEYKDIFIKNVIIYYGSCLCDKNGIYCYDFEYVKDDDDDDDVDVFTLKYRELIFCGNDKFIQEELEQDFMVYETVVGHNDILPSRVTNSIFLELFDTDDFLYENNLPPKGSKVQRLVYLTEHGDVDYVAYSKELI